MLIRIAFRNIFRNRRRSVITLLVVVFGVTALILFGGYREQTFWGLRESTIRSRLGHLQIFRSGYLETKSQKPLEFGLENWEEVRRAVEIEPRVQMATAQISFMGLISNGDKSETFIANAVEPAKDKSLDGQVLISGELISEDETDGVMVGEGLARSMGATAGSYLTLMTTTVSGSLNAMDVRVTGIYATGVQEYDDRAIKMPLAGAQQLLHTKKVDRLIVLLKQTENTATVEGSLTSLFGDKEWPLEMRNWSQLATFYHQVVLLFNGIFGFLGIVIFTIVVVSVANTMMMSIFERTREIGTLMAIGTERRRVWTMFVLEGLLIGIIGGMLGLASGYLLSQGINAADLELPPPPTYTRGYPLQMILRLDVMVIAFLLAVVTATVSAIVPAFKASRLKIVDALGHI